MTKALSFITMLLTLSSAVLMGVGAGIFQTNNNNIFICLGAVGIFLITLRFNIFALRHDRCGDLVAENNFGILVALFLYLYFFRQLFPGFLPALFYSLLGVLGLYLVLIIVLYVRKIRAKRSPYRRR